MLVARHDDNGIYIYVYIYIYIYISLRKKNGHIRIINLFPSCYVFLIKSKRHEGN